METLNIFSSMILELFVSLKYIRAKRKNSYISAIFIISVMVVALSVMTFIAVLSVMNGFQTHIRDKLINSGFHLYLTRDAKTGLIPNYYSLIKKIKKIDKVNVAEPFFETKSIIKSRNGRALAIELNAFNPGIQNRDKTLSKCYNIIKGKFDITKKENIILGSELANFLDVKIGDDIMLIISSGNIFNSDNEVKPKFMQYKVKGVYKIGHYKLDLGSAIISLKSIQELAGLQNKITAIGIKINNIYDADKISLSIKKKIGFKYQIYTWMDINHNLFAALKNEKAILGFIVFLIFIVAAFNIASTLIMIILEKKKDIGILRSMGCTKHQINNIFLLEGGITGILGTLIGLILGLLVSYNLDKIFHLIEAIVNSIMINSYILIGRRLGMPMPLPYSVLAWDVYYLDKLYVIVKPLEVFIICASAIILSLLFSMIPANQAAKLDPVESIRYE